MPDLRVRTKKPAKIITIGLRITEEQWDKLDYFCQSTNQKSFSDAIRGWINSLGKKPLPDTAPLTEDQLAFHKQAWDEIHAIYEKFGV